MSTASPIASNTENVSGSSTVVIASVSVAVIFVIISAVLTVVVVILLKKRRLESRASVDFVPPKYENEDMVKLAQVRLPDTALIINEIKLKAADPDAGKAVTDVQKKPQTGSSDGLAHAHHSNIYHAIQKDRRGRQRTVVDTVVDTVSTESLYENWEENQKKARSTCDSYVNPLN